MQRLSSFLKFLFFASSICLIAIAVFAMDSGWDGNPFQLPGTWRPIGRVLVVLAGGSVLGIALISTVLHRRIVETSAPSINLFIPDESDDGSHPREYLAVFDDQDSSWVIGSNGRNLAAFRQVNGHLSNQMKLAQHDFEIVLSQSHSQATLLDRGRECARIKTAPLSGRIELVHEQNTYRVDAMVLPLIRTRFVMRNRNVTIAEFKQVTAKKWLIRAMQPEKLPLLVFVFWFILRRFQRQHG